MRKSDQSDSRTSANPQQRTYKAHWSKDTMARVTALRAFQRQLTASQWLSSEEIGRIQARKIAALTAHAQAYSPYYKRLLEKASPITSRYPIEYLCEIPVLRRESLQSNFDDLCAHSPERHGLVKKQHTSGSTGQPVCVHRTDLCQMVWLGLTLRDHLWHQRNFSGTLAVIRVTEGQPNQAKRFSTWGEAVNVYSPSGPMHVLPVSTDIDAQARWLTSVNPDYLLSYPSNLVEVLRAVQEEKLTLPRLREIRTFGETVPENLREEVSHFQNLAINDIYSSQELGVIALQCPASGLYHVQSENVCVEVLNDQNEECNLGEIGRVVVTDLHNYAFPLIRYDLGDYAEVGPACPCGRGLPTLRRILGRRRNMVHLPNGQRHWPYVPVNLIRAAMPGLKQCQLVQQTAQQIDARIVVTTDDWAAVKTHAWKAYEIALGKAIQEALGYPFSIYFQYQSAALKKTESGKLEEVICNVL